ncbi:Nicotinamide-nucleotide adenylyltransferase [Quillaja saponaria]|uniref:Nicotinamide-nucleotide adenylyltransferase n=1 Tax=Quillaja saponaria TaxID=32244 RepID=A0AAD7PQ02_QUISA|nr:Nicotinamide-nucleotide adenylyltransferase [Quillaja saponaria]
MMDFQLPLDKLALQLINHETLPGSTINDKIYVVLVATGSFNPATYMHLRMFELARDALKLEGNCVIGGYISPVNDAYKKKGLISAENCILLCHLACKSSEFIMVDPWEANQSKYQQTLTVLSRVRNIMCEAGLVQKGTYCKYCMRKSHLHLRVNIKVVEELVPNQISSTRIRECITRGLSIKHLTTDEVIDYIKEQQLYLKSDD